MASAVEKDGGVQEEESGVEPFGGEDISGQEAVVDRVPVQEGPVEVEGGGEVGEGVGEEEGGGEEELDRGADGELEDGLERGQGGEVDTEQGRREQQDVHLDGDGEAEEEAAEAPAPVEEHVDGGVQQEDGHWVVEQMDDGERALPAGAHGEEGQEVRGHLVGEKEVRKG